MRRLEPQFANGYRLVNAMQRAEMFLTFHLPPMEDRMAVGVGALVKIIVENDSDGERFWVQVLERLPNDQFRGRIENDLMCDLGLDFNDMIEFGIQHIIEIQTKA